MSSIHEILDIQLKLEENACQLYKSFIKKINNPEIKDKITEIRDDELIHIGLVKEMIELIGKSEPKISPAKEKIIDFEGFIDSFNSLFVVTNIEKYSSTILSIIKELQINCIYLSYNKIPKYIKNLLINHKISTDKIRFINCVKLPTEGITIPPEHLTKLSITLEELVKETKGRFFVLVDTISAFSVYHDTATTLKFLSAVNSKFGMRSGGVVWIAIDGESEKDLISKASPLCDKVTRII